MTDVTTNTPMQVRNVGTAGPYLRIPFSQLDEVRRLFDGRGVSYWVSENAISFDGGPEMIVIKFGRNGDSAAVQAILDDGR